MAVTIAARRHWGLLQPRAGASLYIFVWIVGLAGAQWIQYVWPNEVLLKGQPPSIVFTFILWAVSVPLWLIYPRSSGRGGLLRLFFWALLAAWVLNLVIAVVHDDNFNHTVWLYPISVGMLLTKTPSADDAWKSLYFAAWAVTILLVGTRGLEAVGVLSRYYVTPDVVEFDLENYWLPFSGHWGLLGKWTGPFGASAHTAMAAGFVFVVGVVRWTRSSWVFIAVGIGVYLVSASRTMLLACAAAVVIVVLFGNRGPFHRLSSGQKWTVLAVGAAGAALLLFVRGPGLTGRENIWPAYVKLWIESPVIGVGRSGIEAGGGLAAQSDVAHNLFVDLVARSGLAGLIAALFAIGIALVLAVRAASPGQNPGPLALLVAYLVFSMTDVRNEWISWSIPLMIVVLAAIWASPEGRSAPSLGKQVSEKPAG